MNQFVQRIASYLANEVVIKGLANNRAFQRFALRTHESVEAMKKTGHANIQSKLDEVQQAATKAAYSTSSKSSSSSSNSIPPQEPGRGVGGFFSAFAKEVKKDLGMK